MASGMIPRDFIDDLLTRVDIIDVINARVPLKKKGREYTACCPFHNEKTPSFTVSPNKQFYHCFGCGVHGSAISFLMEYEHLEFVESIETLADSLGISVPREKGGNTPSKEQQKRVKDLFTLMEEANDFYQVQLKASKPAIDYLQGRELSGEISKQFNIGFAPEGWTNLSQAMAKNYSQQQLIDSGLLIHNDEDPKNIKTYDRYRNRIMFPIRNRKGQVIGFGGRVLGDDVPKYINSPETTLFHKGSELYGLYEARKFTKKLERIVVVEGYLDVIALAQFGVSYAVATLGTATTSSHIKQLFRAVPEVIFCFDGDRAGREAAWRALNNALPEIQDGKEIRFLFLPDGEDPDTQIRKVGKEAFEKSFVDDALSLTDYFVDSLHQQNNISSSEGKARFHDDAIQYLKNIPDTFIKDQLVTRLSSLIGVSTPAFLKGADQKKSTHHTETNLPRIGNREVRHTPIRYAISLLLSNPELVKFVENIEPIALSHLPGSDLLTTLIEAIQENPNTNAAVLMQRWQGTQYETPLIQLMQWQPETDDIEILANEFKDCINYIHKRTSEQKVESLIHKERTEGLSEQEQQELVFLLQQS